MRKPSFPKLGSIPNKCWKHDMGVKDEVCARRAPDHDHMAYQSLSYHPLLANIVCALIQLSYNMVSHPFLVL